MRATDIVLAASLLSLPVMTQIAPGEVMVSSVSNGEPGESPGTYVAVRNGVVVPLTGLSFPSYDLLLVDPIDGSLWKHETQVLSRARLSGTQVVSETQLAWLQPGQYMGSAVFDADSNVLTTAVEVTTGQPVMGLYRFDRNSGQQMRLQFGSFSSGFVHALVIHPVTHHIYLTEVPSYAILELAPPYTGAVARIGSVAPVVRPATSPVGACFASGGAQGAILLSMSPRDVLKLDLATGAASLFGTIAAFLPQGQIVADRRNGGYWVPREGLDAVDRLFNVDSQGVFIPRVVLGRIGSCYGLTINDYLPGTLNIAPRNITGRAFLLEVGLWGPPGDLAVLAITRPVSAPILLGAGTFDRGGNFHVKLPIPAGLIQPGSPRRIEFTGAAVNLANLSATVYPGQTWPAN